MTLDPRIGMWFSIFLAVVGAVAGASTQLTAIFGQHTAEAILAYATLILSVGAGINAALHAIPSKSGDANAFPLGPKT